MYIYFTSHKILDYYWADIIFVSSSFSFPTPFTHFCKISLGGNNFQRIGVLLKLLDSNEEWLSESSEILGKTRPGFIFDNKNLIFKICRLLHRKV